MDRTGATVPRLGCLRRGAALGADRRDGYGKRGGAPWYSAGYDRALQETPYSFKRRPVLLTQPANWPASCAENRGSDDAPLMLMNHWINTDPTPRPSNAALVNTRAALVGRARECERFRGQRVNLVAVDFVGQGDVDGAVDVLNGVG